jgi:hypothetical protein
MASQKGLLQVKMVRVTVVLLVVNVIVVVVLVDVEVVVFEIVVERVVVVGEVVILVVVEVQPAFHGAYRAFPPGLFGSAPQQGQPAHISKQQHAFHPPMNPKHSGSH